MCKKDVIFLTGEKAPFEETNEIKYSEGCDKCTSYQRETGYMKLCKNCKSVTPESVKEFVADDVSMYDEPYYCYWCEFIRNTDIDDQLMMEEKKAALKEKVNYNDEDDGSDAMWELEDSGAFSDEGIMPGCHSRDWELEYEAKSTMQEFRDMVFIGKCIRLAREKSGMEAKVLADRLKMPESFINEIENGVYINRDGDKPAEPLPESVMPVHAAMPVKGDTKKEERAWWQGCSDDEIRKKAADYLCYVLNPPIIKTDAQD